MKIKCIVESTGAVGSEPISSRAFPDSSVRLRVGKEYLVHALSEYNHSIWYCICDELYTYHPLWFPQHLFQLVDGRISRYWVFSLKKDIDGDRIFFGFPEWANQLDFYDCLTDHEEREVQIFRDYKNRMDLEFSDPSIFEIAQIADNHWLICPICIDAWQDSSGKDALVRCPRCLTIFNNPHYKNEYPHF